jgi:hypothetical protein
LRLAAVLVEYWVSKYKNKNAGRYCEHDYEYKTYNADYRSYFL